VTMPSISGSADDRKPLHARPLLVRPSYLLPAADRRKQIGNKHLKLLMM
jgi:hypothetical protein